MKHYYVGFSLNFESSQATAHIDAIMRHLNIDRLTPMRYNCTESKWRIVDQAVNTGNAFGALIDQNRQIGGMGPTAQGFDETLQSRQSMQTIQLNDRTLIYGGRRSPYKPSSAWSLGLFY